MIERWQYGRLSFLFRCAKNKSKAKKSRATSGRDRPAQKRRKEDDKRHSRTAPSRCRFFFRITNQEKKEGHDKRDAKNVSFMSREKKGAKRRRHGTLSCAAFFFVMGLWRWNDLWIFFDSNKMIRYFRPLDPVFSFSFLKTFRSVVPLFLHLLSLHIRFPALTPHGAIPFFCEVILGDAPAPLLVPCPRTRKTKEQDTNARMSALAPDRAGQYAHANQQACRTCFPRVRSTTVTPLHAKKRRT